MKASRGEPELGSTIAIVKGNVPRRPLAVIVEGPARTKPAAFRLKSGSCIIGSGDECDVVIPDATVSRKHLELTLVPEGISILDLESRNGTFYLGHRVTSMVLSPNSRLTVGRAEIRITADEEALGDALYDGDTYGGMIGSSPAMRRMYALLARLEGSLVTVLIAGESGSGKELVARAIHKQSSVAQGPIVCVNCGAIARELIASELFGHKKGAFTGATDNRQGAFERANGGTLFLDEIGELPLDVQPMLLRALEYGEINAVGDDRTRSVRVRVVAATNRTLLDEVNAGRFRLDLYYRLAVVTISVPSLRERPDDVPELAHEFARQLGVAQLPDEVVAQLAARSFPGNVRELRNAIQTYAALGVLPAPTTGGGAGASKAVGLAAALRERIDLSKPYAALKDDIVDEFTRVYLEALLKETDGNQTTAARVAGLDRSYLGKMIARLGIEKP